MLYHNVYNIILGVGRVQLKTMGGVTLVTLLFRFYFHTCLIATERVLSLIFYQHAR